MPCTVKTVIHPWREHLSEVPDAIECEHLPTQVSYDDKLQSGRDPDEDDEQADEQTKAQETFAGVLSWLADWYDTIF